MPPKKPPLRAATERPFIKIQRPALPMGQRGAPYYFGWIIASQSAGKSIFFAVG
ncbi:hypothetical protein SAMN05518849_112120 [Sphingobium sp. AP50]|nr:hypothetical protein SAMN05518849_112120 [Sphingobium sp. AP50]